MAAQVRPVASGPAPSRAANRIPASVLTVRFATVAAPAGAGMDPTLQPAGRGGGLRSAAGAAFASSRAATRRVPSATRRPSFMKAGSPAAPMAAAPSMTFQRAVLTHLPGREGMPNRLHVEWACAVIRRPGGFRGRVRDTATLLDESGLLWSSSAAPLEAPVPRTARSGIHCPERISATPSVQVSVSGSK